MTMLNSVQALTVGEMMKWLLIIAGCLSTFLEVSKIKINPWSSLAHLIGNAINKEVLKQIGEVRTEQNKLKDDFGDLQEKMDVQETARQEDKIVNLRIRILRYADECREGTPHSKEHWDQIMQDISSYEKYCKAHQEFENNVTVETDKYLKELYHKCLVDNNFL